MPTSTYYNLNPIKKERIENAVKKEFARVPLIDMSVKNIVNDANIARGSFYQYFETREDLIKYILEKEFEKEEVRFLKLLGETNKDIFETAYRYLVGMIEMQEKNSSYYINIYQYLRETKIFPLKNIDLSNVNQYVNTSMLNVNTVEEAYAAIRVIAIITFSKKMEILNNKVSKEKGLKEYKQELDIIKKGLLK